MYCRTTDAHNLHLADSRPLRNWLKNTLLLRLLPVAALFLLLAVLLQYLGHAYSAEFSSYPDAPAHYVNGLLIRDYIAAGFPSPPLHFAETYYVHYPKVSIGMWPPLFAVLEAFWTLLFSVSRTSILLLEATLTAILAATIYWLVRRHFGGLAGLLSGAFFVFLPLVQSNTQAVMADTLVALLSAWAMIWLGEYLETERPRDVLLFALMAALSIITKQNGLALALLPPIGILLTRRYRLLGRSTLWYSALIPILISAPWYYLMLRWWPHTIDTAPLNLKHICGLALDYGHILLASLGVAFIPFVFVGLITRLVVPFWKRELDGHWAAAAALLFSVLAFHSISPTPGAQARYMISAIPPLLMFLAAGILWVSERIPWKPLSVCKKAAVLSACLCVAFALDTFRIPQKQYFGFEEVAKNLLKQPELKHAIFLVSSDNQDLGEGMFIAEVAMHEQRPGHIVLRASKVLSESTWDSKHYKLLYSTPREMMAYLERAGVDVLIVDRTPCSERLPHHQVLLQMLADYPGSWTLIGRYPHTRPATAPGVRIEVYRFTGKRKGTPGDIHINMEYTLGRNLDVKQ